MKQTILVPFLQNKNKSTNASALASSLNPSSSGEEADGMRRGSLKPRRFPVVPLIGPILTTPPLMVGGEISLDPPTPLQWKALQECVIAHRNQLKKKEKEEHDENGKMATVNEAPIIAIIDETTGMTEMKPLYNNPSQGGRYATIAAVVGICPNRKKNKDKNNMEEESFFEYMNLSTSNANNKEILPLDSTVRLVGVGRAVLNNYFYRVPSDGEDDENEDKLNNDYYEVDDAMEEDYNDGYADNTPIVMAEFEPLVDDASIFAYNDPEKIGNKGAKSHRVSPNHAIAYLVNLCNKVSRLHTSRRRVVAGLKAAKARLEMREARYRGEFDDLEDHDGLGLLYANREVVDNDQYDNESEVGMTIDEFLATFKGNMKRIDPSELPQNQPSESEKVEALENYGLNYYGAFSNIPELTTVAMKIMEPYYSKEFRDRDEYSFEVSSFVVWRALEGVASDVDLASSLKCISSIDRLKHAYEVMLNHRKQLQKLAEEISAELLECGEECTDLW